MMSYCDECGSALPDIPTQGTQPVYCAACNPGARDVATIAATAPDGLDWSVCWQISSYRSMYQERHFADRASATAYAAELCAENGWDDERDQPITVNYNVAVYVARPGCRSIYAREYDSGTALPALVAAPALG